tara:strand:- start:599 stop:790 length:192 start_codon:yes stop_codon:yes gene_type:complete
MGLFNTNNEQKALQKIKKLQKWLNKHFPDTEYMEPMAEYKFVEAEDFLTEEARRWKDAKNQKN